MKKKRELIEFGPAITVPTMPWVGRDGLDDAVVESIQESLFSLTDADILGPMGSKLTGFRQGSNQMYDGLRQAEDELEKLRKKQSLNSPVPVVR